MRLKKYPTKHKAFRILYGISQNPDTGDYNLVQNGSINSTNKISGNEKIDDFIQERQLKINNYNDIVLEWIPYDQFIEVKETGKNSLIKVYSAIWKDGPLHYQYGECTRNPNKEVTLKCLPKSQESIDSLINEAKKYPTNHKAFQILYGISQNSDTEGYILVLIWTSGNEKIDDFIQEKQLKTNNNDNNIDKYNDIDGPLHYNQYGKYTRNPSKEVALKCLHKSQESIDSLINESKKYPTNHKAFQTLYGISQNPDTKDYILVLMWTSGNEKIDDFIQEKQLKINSNYEIVPEWILYNQLSEIKEIGKNDLIAVYTAKWKDAKKYPTKYKAFQVLYGISQNPDKNDYILVQNNFINLINWTSGNEKIDDFIQERQLIINNYDDIVLEWISHNQFNEIKEIGKNVLITVYSATWIDGPLYYSYKDSNYIRDSNKEAKKYPSKHEAIQVLYGITQNPDTGNYLLVQNNYSVWISENEEINDLILEMQLKINNYDDIVFEWIPYNQFNNIKEVGKGGFAIVYSATWINGPLEYDANEKIYKRNPNIVIA
ncbi:unnamed protein product [Rhizophagus irregularis]|nr:unnamed protein product [Rhizophagus irregularis]